MQKNTEVESINCFRHLGVRPFCNCCGGGKRRKGFNWSKVKSMSKNNKARKPRYKDHK
jgi:hypothetical protein